jgi:PadR family transcriptional regulator PadR
MLGDGSRALIHQLGKAIHRELTVAEGKDHTHPSGVGKHAEDLDRELDKLAVGQPPTNPLICIHTQIIAHTSSVRKFALRSPVIIAFRYRHCDTESVTDDEPADELEYRDLLSGLVRMHILHHASLEEVYGVWLIDELAHHGYRLSAGTLYPMLHKMVSDGYLVVRSERDGRTVRKLYSATEKGRSGLAVARERVRIFAPKEPKK